jgi:hypothetical protein
VGEWLFYFSEPARQMASLERSAYVRRARSPGSRLTQEEIEDLAAFMLNVQELPTRREYFRTRPIETTFQGLVIPLIDWVTEHDPKVKLVLNVGAHYGFCDHVNASRHPGIQFLSIDFAPNLAEFNEEFIRDNLSFRSGYALDCLESGEVKPDVIVMSSTAVVIKNAEISRYLKIAKELGSYFIFNEPLYNLPGEGVVDPLMVNSNESLPAYQYLMLNGKLGPLCYTHNYKKLAEHAGMNVLVYRAFRPTFTDLRMVQLIAKA